jgi:Tol biopolymer transport system component
MPATRITASRRGKRLLIAALLLVSLLLGLAACRGFFGQAPIASLVIPPPTDHQAPVTVEINISGSTDPDGTIASYDLDFGDGSAHDAGTAIPATPISHTYQDEGTYTVKLTVTDNDGRIGVASQTVTIGALLTVFATNRSDDDYAIWKMKTDGTSPEAVLNTAGQDNLFPSLIPGTRDKIAYAYENGTSWNLKTMTIEGYGLATLTTTNTQTPSNYIQPSWSSDGAKIAYASNLAQTPSTTTWQIYTIDPTIPSGADSGQLLPTTQTPAWAPVYSPVDPDTLVYVASNAGTDTGTAIYEWDGTTTTALTPATGDWHYGDASPAFTFKTALDLPAGAGISTPTWSPDGAKLAYASNYNGTINIYVIDLTATNPALTSQTLEAYVNSLLVAAGGTTVSSGTISSSAAEFCPHWLEDGSGMVFTRETSAGVFNVYKVDFATGTVTNLTNSTTSNISPAAAHR